MADSQPVGVKGVKAARHDLVHPYPNHVESEVYAFGAEKYFDRNWERGYDWGKSLAALERHIAAFKAGEDLDPESGLPHLAHARWHTGVLLVFWKLQLGTDDRTNLKMSLFSDLLNADEIAIAKAKEQGNG